ncbi:MFS transporter [Ramlibacter sp.]|uniref:MFS transporter n=1 Tax=Ramlibacter sp. TaxID=1917967 RepID=UPI0017E74F01|nr:MFS transporter [Ramlibacter sp.]MBA2676313.1 MFS transporter [Ramlibacter sp.]
MSDVPAPPPSSSSLPRALLVIFAGVCGAVHVAKLPPAIHALQQQMGLSLVDAGFLLSMVQLAGMTTAIAMGAWADSLGGKCSMVLGLLVLAAASTAGGFAGSASMLLALRALEGFGFLLVVVPAPALVRQPPGRVSRMLGLWGSYMPLGTAIALLAGPLWIDHWGWRHWWWSAAALSAAMAVVLMLALPARPNDVPAQASAGLLARLHGTLSRGGPWLLAVAFATYSSQWLAVVGFLPTIYQQAGVESSARGVLTALAAAVNIIGNVGAGRLLHRGTAPVRLLSIGFVAMGLSAVVAFAGAEGAGAPPAVRYIAVLCFSMVGGLVPATLFALAMRLAPDERTISTTIGWMQQWSAFGQFAGPPVVAWVASHAGGWHWTWAATGTAALVGLGLAQRIGRLAR